MNESLNNSQDAGLDRLLELAAEAAHAPLSEEHARAERQRLLARVAAQTPRSRQWPKALWLLGGTAGAAAAGFAVWVLLSGPAPQLTYDLEGGSVADRGYVSSRPDSPATLRFSDGSTVRVVEGARLRVQEARAEGAHLVLERGTATVEVRHRSATRWAFTAGPFEVRVTGTRFDLHWDPAAEELDLRLYQGAVEVQGPTGRGPIALRAGEHFHARVAEGSFSVAPLSSDSAIGGGPQSLPGSTSAAPDPSGTPSGSPSAALGAPSAAVPVAGPSWSQLVRKGSFREVLVQAEQRGIEACLGSCGESDLMALADAARYSGRSGVTGRALQSLRQRFPGSGSASTAAFLLGRVAEGRGAGGEADRWYRVYLAEAPRGAFAADALVGRMRLGSGESARALARELLSRYPSGVHAEAARKVLAQP